MITPYSQKNAVFTDSASQAARKILYPSIFGTQDLLYEEVSDWQTKEDEILDGQMGIDRVVKVAVPGLRGRIKFTFQERFRKSTFASYRDLTITEWNTNSNLPSELYKITAGIFLYGYFDEANDFVEAIAINTTELLYKLAMRQVKYDSRVNPRSNQTFLCFLFDDLINSDLVIYHYKKSNNDNQ